MKESTAYELSDLTLPLDHRISDYLEMGEGRRYSRVGNWRIIFQVEEKEKIIFITAI
jgi:mRNA-degrading endonuclease RelE of RelBE toxin-antitoxin system